MQLTHLFSEAGLQAITQQFGIAAPLLYILLIIITVVIGTIPGLPLVCAAGMAWGGFLGGLYSIIGGFLGSVIAYGLGRTLGNSAIKALTGKTCTLAEHKSERFIISLIFITRLVPIFPFDLISYSAGVARLSFPLYAGATLLGMIPPTFAFSFVGTASLLEGAAGWMIWPVVGVVLVAAPWAIWRYNCFQLKDMIQVV